VTLWGDSFDLLHQGELSNRDQLPLKSSTSVENLSEE